ncbi:hypothetical protein Kpol_1048p28 [Vanderwaltozyma polyspora DSM 70294]|uniref:Glycerophosphodiester phosphodiesterase GDE1 n=1 Tax=Vanderwaltozyma polyspora (strain ATCC 22028 / DSM 70294 / BCRC 21397 / CBS 2163 / NBRC 10782 / NRRL Y-8283 / UCD 57-17) TaxID=436907 RepID=A7TGJ1_VANPO|nr:uncharacterized protein Kpol_1048p28 [Vanderwaltozyma polyspora DSM 70294]EDO18598.1 hypothetical protein Kpol_1048p28 [Vanderwaltozyma polyspora DSM 70294]
MKFAKTFPKYQIPDWSTKYINYRALKKVIKKIEEQQEILFDQDNNIHDNDDITGSEGINSSPPRRRRNVHKWEENYLNDENVKILIDCFLLQFNEDLKKVETFYMEKSNEYNKRLNRLLSSSQFLIVNNQFDDVEKSSNLSIDLIQDLQEIKYILLRLSIHFQELKSYCELNKKACLKILKKLDKKIGTSIKESYYIENVEPLSFINYNNVKLDIQIIENIMEKFVPELINIEKDSINQLSKIFNNNKKNPLLAQDEIFKFIEKDDSKQMKQLLLSKYEKIENIPIRYFINLLNNAALFLAFSCIDTILAIIPSLQDNSDLNYRNFFHYHIITLGENYEVINNFSQEMTIYRETSTAEIKELSLKREDSSLAFDIEVFNNSNSKISFGIVYILESLDPKFYSCLVAKDGFGRTVLHYAAQYGLADLVDIIMEKLIQWDLWDSSISIDSIDHWGDIDSKTPMELAIIGKHPLTITRLLQYVITEKANNSLVQLAISLKKSSLVRALFSRKCYDINGVDSEYNESNLYIASKLNLPNIVKFLLENGASTDITESLFSWNPLFIAAVEGYKEIVQLLLDFGANKYIFDESGWTPMEQATLNGYLDIAELISLPDKDSIMKPNLHKMMNTSSKPIFTLDSSTKISDMTTNDNNDSSANNNIPTEKKENGTNGMNGGNLKQTKSFGHDHLESDQSVILVTLGGHDSRIQSPAISIDKDVILKSFPKAIKNGLSLSIVCLDASEREEIIDLPLDFNPDSIRINVPYKSDFSHIIYFSLLADDEVTSPRGTPDFLQFNKNTATASAPNKKVIGRAIAFLNKTGTFVGNNKRSLNDIATIPIIGRDSLDVLGSVTFEFLIITPFKHSKMTFERTEAYWKSLVSTRVIGHRGLGKNYNTKKTLQLGENTVESFIAAASLGASYVEFDVQLTKDSVPVVYHDFLVAETGVDIPMHELTLEQFLNLNNCEKHISGMNKKGRRNSIAELNSTHVSRPWENISSSMDHIRGYSHKTNEDGEVANSKNSSSKDFIDDRMRLTKTFKKYNFKGNTRGFSISSSFVTLEELFKKIPANVGFNIECKYPMVDEAEEEETGHVMTEMNHWIDTVLKVIFDNANGRDIIFSSFHPDICVMLSLKQPSIPILFLTEGGTTKMADLRAASLQNAIRFARNWNLLGIVSAAKPILLAPRLVRVVKTSGLVCVTYGVENNEPENVVVEMNAGVDAVIVDSVLAVRKGLTKES